MSITVVTSKNEHDLKVFAEAIAFMARPRIVDLTQGLSPFPRLHLEGSWQKEPGPAEAWLIIKDPDSPSDNETWELMPDGPLRFEGFGVEI